MWEELKHILEIVYEEAKHRRWYKTIKFLLAVLGFIGFSAAVLHPLLKKLFPSSVMAVWVILVSVGVVVALCVAIHLIHGFHKRVATETLVTWTENTELLEELSKFYLEGRQFANNCMRESFPAEDIGRWHRHLAGVLERKLGTEYRRRFYEHSETFESAPNTWHQCKTWIETRLVKLGYVIHELKEPPPQLTSSKTANKLEPRTAWYLGIGEE
jgi:hypothetical protein